ncbi:HAD-IA family hydrolase [Prosthecobacter vanneervenii]|uniref:Putative hydrolase of the HAD superfamily n=1 Tax=Prosthecobacter vanneervenii TaxID=48466 RepID=A0A7W7YBM4_9BACT|nr:HAD-IA family hydrolase [Prosthecobacter vanneervenii]MBB5033191.1 putative hydrolase of the HAD superfamily [Prosthecobacter vanneervenii]
MALSTLFFDAAGTLIRPAESVGQTYAQHAQKLGIEADPETLMQAFRAVWKQTPPPLYPVGQPSADDDRGWWRTLVGDVFGRVHGAPLQESVLDELFDGLYRHFAKAEAWHVFDDVLPALEDLARDHRLLVLSNFDRRLHSILGGHDLLRFFDGVVISSEVGAAKPHARMFETALEAAGCQPGQALHIGDDVRCDLGGAQSCGIHAFQVKRPESDLGVLVQKVRSGAYSGLRNPDL